MSRPRLQSATLTSRRAYAGKGRGVGAIVLLAILLFAGSAAVRPKPADAYLVCGLDCPHEYMAKKASDVWSDGDINAFWNDIQSGITHEDGYDHVYGLNASLVLIGEPFLTATHFWNADLGEGRRRRTRCRWASSRTPCRRYVRTGRWRSGPMPTATRAAPTTTSATSSTTSATTRSRRTFTTTRTDRSRSTTTHSTTGWTRWGNPPPNAGVSSAEQATLVNAGPLPSP